MLSVAVRRLKTCLTEISVGQLEIFLQFSCLFSKFYGSLTVSYAAVF